MIAADRKAEQELGIERGDIGEMHRVARLRYRAKCDEEFEEWEVDHILIAQVDELVMNLNPEEVSDVKWVTMQEMQSMRPSRKQKMFGGGEGISPWLEAMCQMEGGLFSWWESVLVGVMPGELMDIQVAQ